MFSDAETDDDEGGHSQSQVKWSRKEGETDGEDGALEKAWDEHLDKHHLMGRDTPEEREKRQAERRRSAKLRAAATLERIMSNVQSAVQVRSWSTLQTNCLAQTIIVCSHRVVCRCGHSGSAGSRPTSPRQRTNSCRTSGS